jgi:predicted nucleotidyltransferase
MDGRPPTRWDLARRRLADRRRAAAVEAARRAVAVLAARGVRALVFGSLARGDFAPHSDVDLLVVHCPEGLHYRIEAAVEDVMAGLPFDVVYLDELPEPARAEALEEAMDAADLCPAGA